MNNTSNMLLMFRIIINFNRFLKQSSGPSFTANFKKKNIENLAE